MDNFREKFKSWLAACQLLINKQYEKSPLSVPILEVMEGKRYIRIVKRDPSSASAFAFIEIQSGDVLKPAGYKTPAKTARGNIFDEHNGMRFMSAYGPAYLR